MQPYIPPELLELIIDEAEDSPPTLRSLSLVSKQCAFRARRNIFKRVDLGYEDKFLLLRTTRRSEQMERLRNLRKLFEANERLASCVKSINIRMAAFAETVFIENLPPVLQRLTSLSAVQITGFETCGDVLHWGRIPKQVADSIAECLLQPGIYEVTAKCLRSVPSLIFSSPSLKRLHLVMVGPGTGIRTLSSTTSCTALTELVVAGSSEFICRTIALASPSMFSHLKTLQMVFHNSLDWTTCTEVLRACRGTVERIVLVVHWYSITCHEEDMLLLPHVKHLELSVFSSGDTHWGRPDPHCPQFVQDLRMVLSKYGTKNLEVLESLSLQIIITTAIYNLKVANGESVSILREAYEWPFLDEYLFGLANSGLMVKLNFKMYNSHGGFDPRNTNQLCEEASAKLVRAAQTGRLAVSIDISPSTPPKRSISSNFA